MIEITNIKSLVNLPREPEDGEIALCHNSNQKYRYSKDLNDWVPYKELTKYEYEAGLAAQWAPYTEEELEAAASYIDEIFMEDFAYNVFILIGLKDFNRYLTIFQNDIRNREYKSLGQAVVKQVGLIGSMVSCNQYEDGKIDIWVKTKDGMVQLSLINYQEGVIKL